MDKACIALKPPTPAIVTGASDPPATITSAYPTLIYVRASISAFEDEAQAETVA